MSAHPTSDRHLQNILDELSQHLSDYLAEAIQDISKKQLANARSALKKQIRENLPLTQLDLGTWETLHHRFEETVNHTGHDYPEMLMMAVELIFATTVIKQVDDNHHLKRFIDKAMIKNNKLNSSEHVLLETAIMYLEAVQPVPQSLQGS